MVAHNRQSDLEKAIQGRKAAVLFHATWCPFCRRFKPVFDRVAARATGMDGVEVLLDDESNPMWTHYRINVVPTVLFFQDGKVERRLDGQPGVGLTEQELTEAFRSLGALP